MWLTGLKAPTNELNCYDQLALTWNSATPPGGRGTTVRQAGQVREGAGGGARDSRQVRQKVWKHGSSLGRRYFSRHTAHVSRPDVLSPPVAILSGKCFAEVRATVFVTWGRLVCICLIPV